MLCSALSTPIFCVSVRRGILPLFLLLRFLPLFLLLQFFSGDFFVIQGSDDMCVVQIEKANEANL